MPTPRRTRSAAASLYGFLYQSRGRRGQSHFCGILRQESGQSPAAGRRRLWPAVAVALALGLPAPAAAANWLAGPTLQKRLAQPVDILWSGNTLRAALENLGRTQEIAVFLDRRVDPGRKLNLTASQTPLGAVLREVAKRQELGVCSFGPVSYFGPADYVRRLRTLAALQSDEARKLPADLARRLAQLKPMAWDDLAEPRSLLAELARQGGLKLQAPEQLPHDLWAAADLPPLSLCDRLTLVAGQFDLACAVDPQSATLTLRPIAAELALVRSYDGGKSPDNVARQYAALAPDAQIKVVGDRVWVKGLLEDHERISGPREPAPPHPPRPIAGDRAHTRFTISVVEKPLGPVLEQLAAQLKLELRMDRRELQRAGVSLDQRVSFNVKQATADELFAAVLKATPLTFRIADDALEIRVKK